MPEKRINAGPKTATLTRADEGNESISSRSGGIRDQLNDAAIEPTSTSAPGNGNIVICTAATSSNYALTKVDAHESRTGKELDGLQAETLPLPRFLDGEVQSATQPGAYAILGRRAHHAQSSAASNHLYHVQEEEDDDEEEGVSRGILGETGGASGSGEEVPPSVIVSAELVDPGEVRELEALRETKLRELEELEAIRKARTSELQQLEIVRGQTREQHQQQQQYQSARGEGQEPSGPPAVLAVPIKQVRCLGMQMSQRTVILMCVVVALIVVDVLVLGLVTNPQGSSGETPAKSAVLSPTSSPTIHTSTTFPSITSAAPSTTPNHEITAESPTVPEPFAPLAATAAPTKRLVGAFAPLAPTQNETMATSGGNGSGNTSVHVPHPGMNTTTSGTPKPSSPGQNDSNTIAWVLLGTFSLVALGMLLWSFLVADKVLARSSP